MKIKPGDKFKTRDGQEVEIDRIDTEGAHPVFGRVKVWQQCNWTVDGKWLGGPRDHDMDLVFPPKTQKTRWLNWYGYAKYDDCYANDRTHVLEIRDEDGEPVEIKIHKVEK